MPEFKEKIYNIDVANVCNLRRNSNGKPMIKIFDSIVKYLKNHGIPQNRIIGFSDCNFQYHVDNIVRYSNLIRSGEIIEMPAGIKADKAILAYCLKHEKGVILSQDLFREYYKYLPSNKWILEKRICVVMVKNELFLIPMVDKFNERSKLEKEISKGINCKIPEFMKEEEQIKDRTTLDVLTDIQKSILNSEWDLFSNQDRL